MTASDRCKSLRLGEDLELIVLGSGGPRSAGRAGSSYLISATGVPRMLVDLGPGAIVRLGETGLSSDQLDTVLLTHLHIDHSGDLPAFVKSQDLKADSAIQIRIIGPSARGAYPSTSAFVSRLFGTEGAFAYLPGFRLPLKLTATDLAAELEAPPRPVEGVLPLHVTHIAVDHGDVPALAYRIDHGGRSIVVSGDLASKRTRLVELAHGADVLVYDAAVLDPPGSPAALYELHTPPKRIGEVARDASVGLLLLSHIPPASEEHADEMLASVRAGGFRGEARFAHDCMHVVAKAARGEP